MQGGITTPMNTAIDNNRIHLQCKFRSQAKMAKWLVLKE